MGGIQYSKRIISQVLSVIFPEYCLLCQQEGDILCSTCINTLVPTGVFYCPGCHQPYANGMHCSICISSLDQQIAFYEYTKDISRCVKAWKYEYREKILTVFLPFVFQFLKEQERLCVDAICPIPLHKKRFAERGFNQAAQLATGIQAMYDKPIMPLLSRKKQTKKQSTLHLKERQKNISADTFQYIGKETPKRVLLVDDVFTTGATMQAAAAVLKQHGVSHVVGLTLARALPH